MTTPSSLLCQVEAGVAWITLNRPDQRNALDIPTLQKLHGLLDDCNADPAVRVLVLTGSGRSFCAGADLAEWAEAEARGALESYGWTETAHALMSRLYSLDKPTIAAINGTAVGAGMDLSLCCDLRIAARSARFKAGYTSMAYSPDAGASWHLPRLIGSEQAKRLLFLDEPWGPSAPWRPDWSARCAPTNSCRVWPGRWPHAWPAGRPLPLPRPSDCCAKAPGAACPSNCGPSWPPACCAGAARMAPRPCAPLRKNARRTLSVARPDPVGAAGRRSSARDGVMPDTARRPHRQPAGSCRSLNKNAQQVAP